MEKEASYVCTFSPEVARRAREELHEDPREREGQVETLREWIRQQPHIKCRTDTAFLLMFLRGAKFSQLRACEMIEGNMRMHTSFPEWFQNIDTRNSKLQSFLDLGYSIPLPKKDPTGAQILLYRVGAVPPDTKKFPLKYEIQAGMVSGGYASLDESIAVTGFIFIFDFTGMSAKHLTRWTLEDMKKWMKAWQSNMPGRFKAFHYYNTGTFFEAMMAMIKPFLSKKFQERIKVHDTMESLYKDLPMDLLPEDYLPDDYEGPNQGSMAAIIKNFKNEVTKDGFRNMMLEFSSNKYGIDKSKRQVGVQAASFRKLNID